MNTHCRQLGAAAMGLAAVLACRSVAARDIWESADGERSASLETALKGTVVVTRADDDLRAGQVQVRI